MKNYFPMNHDKKPYTIVFTNHVFDYRDNGQTRKGALTKANIRELIRNSFIKDSSILEKKNYRYVITYPRTNEHFSAILVSKEGNEFVVITIVHSEVKYQRQGLLPKEKNSVDFNEEETAKALQTNKPKVEKVIPFRRKIKKVNVA